MTEKARGPDPLTAASVTVAWVIIGNKPFYPFYVWWLIGREAALVSLWTLVATPLFAAVPFLAGRAPHLARLVLVLVGIADTAFASLMLGAGTGAIFFFFPCLMLAVLCFFTGEAWRTRVTAALAFVAFALLAKFGGAGVHGWTTEEARTLSSLNLYCAIALSAFIALRFSTVSRDAPLDA